MDGPSFLRLPAFATFRTKEMLAQSRGVGYNKDNNPSMLSRENRHYARRYV